MIDVSLREPRQQELTTTLNTSFIDAGILVESGIGDDQAFYAAFRRSMLDIFVENDDVSDEEKGFEVDQFPISKDYQLKYRWQMNEANSLTVLAAGASDILAATFFEGNEQVAQDPDFAGPAEIQRGFDSFGLRWNIDDEDYQVRLFLNHLSDDEEISFGRNQFENTASELSTLRVLFDKSLFDNHYIKSGVSATAKSYDIDFNAKLLICNDFDPQCSTVDAAFIAYQDQLKVNSYELFIEDQWLLSEQHVLSVGLHYDNDDYLEEGRIEPRVKWEYFVSDSIMTYIAAGQYSQLPELREIIDVLGNPDLTTVKADHFVWGVSQTLSDGWRWSLDTYYKDLQDIVLSAEQDETGENYNNSAEGSAYGFELLLNKDITDRWYGWVSLSLAETERTNTVTGETVKFEYDKPVLFNLVMNRLVGEKWMLGIKWNYQSGARYTGINELVPSQTNPDVLVPVYGDLNAYRLPDYHRLDFRAEYTQPKAWGYWKFYVDILNVYNRENIEGYSLSLAGDDLITPPPGFGQSVPVKKDEGDGFFPSIGFEVQF